MYRCLRCLIYGSKLKSNYEKSNESVDFEKVFCKFKTALTGRLLSARTSRKCVKYVGKRHLIDSNLISCAIP